MLVRTLLLWSSFASVCWAQANEADSKDSAKVVRQWASKVANKVEIFVGEEETPAQIRSQSLLHWSNSTNGDVYGDCYLWTSKSRPVAFLSIYAHFAPSSNRRLTFQSLSEQPLVAKINDKVVWSPSAPGIHWNDLGPANVQNQTPEMLQRRFRTSSSTFEGFISEVNDVEKLVPLRLLNQPIYKYETEDHSKVGALYAFADGTDPEILLWFESALAVGTKARYALIRQNHRRLVVNRDSQKVWELPQIAPPFPNPDVSDPLGVYYNAPWSEYAARASIDIDP